MLELLVNTHTATYAIQQMLITLNMIKDLRLSRGNLVPIQILVRASWASATTDMYDIR